MRNSRTRQQKTLNQVDRLAWLLDNSIRIPLLNYRIGLDALIGLIPGLGDWAGMLISSYIVLQSIRLGAPGPILGRMVLNIGLEALIGLIPILGDIFDATFKSNARNVRLLNSVLGNAPAANSVKPMVSRWVIGGVIGALLVILVLIGVAGVALISWLISLTGN